MLWIISVTFCRDSMDRSGWCWREEDLILISFYVQMRDDSFFD